MSSATKWMKQGRTKRETFPIISSVDEKIYYNLAWYHILSKDGKDFLCFNVLNRVCLLIFSEKKSQIKIPQDTYQKFQKFFYKLRNLKILSQFEQGLICSYGLISWEIYGQLKNTILQLIEPLGAKLEHLILDKLDKLKLKKYEDQLEKFNRGSIGTYEEHIEQGIFDEAS